VEIFGKSVKKERKENGIKNKKTQRWEGKQEGRSSVAPQREQRESA
jgi:hypothetical protein